MAPEVLEQTDEEAAAEAQAALEAEKAEKARLAEQDAEADARAEQARLQAEQDALDAEDRQTPDRPEGAADELDAADRGEEPDDPEAQKSLAEQLRDKAGITDDHAEARGELPGMPERKLTGDVGGNQPTVSEFKLNGRSIDLGAATQFPKGTATRFIIDVRWDAVNVLDKRDKETQDVTDTIRRHQGKIVHYELVAVDEEG